MSKTAALSIVGSTAAVFAPLLITGGLALAPAAQACGTLPVNDSECDVPGYNPTGTLPSDFQQAAGVGDDLKNWWTDNQWKPTGPPGVPPNRTDPAYDCQDTLACW